jgi:D-proline reductase (dithiol) PrdB
MERSDTMINTEALQRSYNQTREKWDPHFEWVVNESAPWTPLRQPLSQTALALVSTCGAYRRDVDCPFDAANFYGDPSFKEIPKDTPVSALDFAHTHYNHEHVSQDSNVAFPLDHLRALEAEKVIGRFVNPAISFTGFLPEPRQLLIETAPNATRRLLDAGAQAALLTPC